MLLRMSTLFLRTLREDPADAEVPSHRLLVRAGLHPAGGARASTPGCRSAGASTATSSASSARRWTRWARRRCTSRRCFPASPTRRTNRWTEYGDDIFRLKDRKGADYLLGPTHEEMFTLLVKDLYSSYKDLPLSLYQIQTKYRDEAAAARRPAARPRVRDEGLLLLRRRRRRARPRRTTRTARPTSRSSTGSASTTSSSRRCPAPWAARASEEFLTPAENGEDTFVRCTIVRLRGQRRGGARAGAAGAVRTTTCRPPTSRTRRTPRPSRLSSTLANERPTCAATTALDGC